MFINYQIRIKIYLIIIANYQIRIKYAYVIRNRINTTQKRLYDLLPHTHYKPSVAKIVQPFLIS